MRHPVVRLSFGRGDFKEPGYLRTNLAAQLAAIERRTATERCADTAPDRFAHLLLTAPKVVSQNCLS